MTSLTVERVREAEAAVRRLNGQPHTLVFCIEYALTNYCAPEREHLLTEATAEYLAAKNRDVERGVVSAVQVGNIKKELKQLLAHFPSGVVSTLKPEGLTAFCECRKPALKTYDNRRSILSTFFKFALQKSWINRNPVEKIPYYRIAYRRGSARTLTAKQASSGRQFRKHYMGILLRSKI